MENIVIEIKVIINDYDDPMSMTDYFGALLKEMRDNNDIKDFEVKAWKR